MPAFIRREMGEKAPRQAIRAIGCDFELIESERCFIPHAALIGSRLGSNFDAEIELSIQK